MLKRTDVYEIRDSPKGRVLKKASGYGIRVRRSSHAYSCLAPDCVYDFRVKWPAEKDIERHGVQVTCPICGSLYVEWLSFKFKPQDVFLTTEEEWDLVPRGRLTKRTLKRA